MLSSCLPLLQQRSAPPPFACLALHSPAAMEALHTAIDNFNAYVGKSTFGRIFRLDGSGHVRLVAADPVPVPRR